MFRFYYEGNTGSLKGLMQESGRIPGWAGLPAFRVWEFSWRMCAVVMRRKGSDWSPKDQLRGCPLHALLSRGKTKV